MSARTPLPAGGGSGHVSTIRDVSWVYQVRRCRVRQCAAAMLTKPEATAPEPQQQGGVSTCSMMAASFGG